MALINCPECGIEVSDKAEKCPKCAFPINSLNSKVEISNQQLTIAMINKKSKGVGLLLTLLFGPIGMLYSTVNGAITMLIIGIAIIVASFALFGVSFSTDDFSLLFKGYPLLFLGSIVYWIMCLVMTVNSIDKHNAKIIEDISIHKTNESLTIDSSVESVIIKLNSLIDKERTKGLFGKSVKNEINNLIGENNKSKNDALNLIKSYNLKFKTDLIEDLKSLSSSYDAIKEVLSIFIEFNVVENMYPHKLID